ncbi:nicotinate phosphoribosyltransferase, partial [Aerococcus urinae]|nr:nicotinate phosphoribosyltransferase [Aerococcus urinae]
FHPTYTYINKTVEDFSARPLLQTVYQDGKRVYDLPALEEVKAYAEESLAALWDEYKRILNPEAYPVDLSQELYDLKMD